MRWFAKSKAPNAPNSVTTTSARAGIATAAVGMLTVAFPFLVLFATDHIGTWPLIALLVCAAALRLLVGRTDEGLGVMMAAQAGAVALIVGIGLFDADLGARLYPVAVNGAMLSVFGASLASEMPIVERFARLSEPALPPSGVAYCRLVTKVWCGFFVLNGAIALATTLWADRVTWALYNGFVAYVLIGCLLGVEYTVRGRVRRAALDGTT